MQGNVQVSVSYWGTCLTWDVMNLKPPPTHDESALHAMEEVAGPNRRVGVDLPVDSEEDSVAPAEVRVEKKKLEVLDANPSEGVEVFV